MWDSALFETTDYNTLRSSTSLVRTFHLIPSPSSTITSSRVSIQKHHRKGHIIYTQRPPTITAPFTTAQQQKKRSASPRHAGESWTRERSCT